MKINYMQNLIVFIFVESDKKSFYKQLIPSSSNDNFQSWIISAFFLRQIAGRYPATLFVASL
jgi:hypothetical protein